MAVNTPPNPPPRNTAPPPRDTVAPARGTARGRRSSWGWGALIAILVVIGLVWWLWPDDDADPVAESPAVTAPGVATDEPATPPLGAGEPATTTPGTAAPVTAPAQ